MTHPPYLTELNPEQRYAVTCSARHVLVLAGAGCGKTKTIVARALHLIDRGIDPSRIYMMTFTRKAAAELVERVQSQADAKGLKASTFHSWCMSFIRSAPKIFGSQITVIDRDDQLQLFRMAYGNINPPFEKRAAPKAKKLLEWHSLSCNTMKPIEKCVPSEFRQFTEYAKQASDFYTQRKREKNYLDYDDVLAVVADKMHTDERVRNWIASKYDYILIDEMQDTNPLQWRLISPLIDKVQFYCVGDDAQSIYGFRGADFRNVHEFQSRVPDSEVCKLSYNYRSCAETRHSTKSTATAATVHTANQRRLNG